MEVVHAQKVERVPQRPNARNTLEFGEYVQEYEGEYIDLKPVELREIVIEW